MNKEFVLKINLVTLVMIAIGATAFFVGYYFATYQKVGYNEGYDTGYLKGMKDLFAYNVQPDSWIVMDQKLGYAAMNGTNVVFAWQDTNQNKTNTMTFKSESPIQYQVVKGVLVLLSDPVKVPQQLVNSSGLHPQTHYVFEDQNRNKYLLVPNQ